MTADNGTNNLEDEESVEAADELSPEERDLNFGNLDEQGNLNENDEVERLRADSAENHNKYLRALADFENYKKRVLKERSEQLKYQGEKVFVDIIDIVDNLELALKHAEAEPGKLREGVEMIHQMFRSTLDKWEVRQKPGKGEKFDPNQHSAISRVPTADAEPGTIIDELKSAYFYKDRLLRPGEVVVAVAPEGADGGSEE